MKKAILILLAALTFSATAYADEAIKLVKGTEEIVSDVSAYKDGETVMIPLRAVFESMGMSVSWDHERRTIIMVDPKTSEFIALQVGSENAFLGENMIEVKPVAKILQNRTFVPLEFIIDNFSDNAEWDTAASTLKIK